MTYDAPGTARIERRFRGPEDSGNGGYSCGLFSRALDEPVVEVSLLEPVPLERDLQLVRPAESTTPGNERPEAMALLDGKPIAEIRPGRDLSDLEPPLRPTPDQARKAAEDSPFLDPERATFTSCFVCGPDHEAGLGIYAGRVEGSDPKVYACTFELPADLADLTHPAAGEGDGSVPAQTAGVWAALDCPSCLPDFWGETPAVLATLSAEILAPVPTCKELVVVAWELEREGRKLTSASAILDPEGGMLARARALWIRLRSRG